MTNAETSGHMKNSSRTTLFVRNLSKDTTREELAKVFVDVGPVKHAIVIHERHGGPSKGFGFVTFALETDAEEAFSRTFECKGKKLHLDWASDAKKAEQSMKESKEPSIAVKRKSEPAKEKAHAPKEEQEESHEAEQNEGGAVSDEAAAACDERSNAEKPFVDWRKRKDERRKATAEEEEEHQRTIVLFNLPSEFTEQQLRKRLKKRGGGVITSVTRDEESGLVHVAYSDASTINAAVKEISGREWGGVTVFARRYHQVALTPAHRSRNRLIVRNLGFHVKEDQVREACAQFGPVQEVVIRRGEDGKSKGFGFVQFYCRHDAQKAVDELNATTALGPRDGKSPIAVDFALAKDRYEALKQKEASQPQVQEYPDSSDEEEEATEEPAEAKEESSDASEGSESEEEDEEDEEESKDEAKEAKTQTVDKGVREGRTLFVRNLLFETDDATLRKRFGEFGSVRGVKLIKDASGRSKGLGFVEFWEKKSCDAALESGEITLEGRAIYVNRAVDKQTATTLKRPDELDSEENTALSKKQKKIQNDKRHLYLAGEGRVPIDNVPNADKKKRQALEDEKRTKLKSPLFFVSPTRLSVKNLNRKPNEVLDSKGLKKLFKEAAIRGLRERVVKDGEGDRALFPQGKMPSVRVLKALLFQDAKDDPFSKTSGFAFVEMAHHIHALAALRILNNNPEYAWAAAGGKQAMKLPEETRPRLIVSFAIENVAKVRAQNLRQEKTKKNPSTKEPTDIAEEASEDEESHVKDDVIEADDVDAEPAKGKPKAKTLKTKKQDKAKGPTKGDQKKSPSKKRAANESEEPLEKKAVKKSRKQDKDISNRAFEKQVRKRPAAKDALDEIVAKRSNLFEIPEEQQSKTRWYDA